MKNKTRHKPILTSWGQDMSYKRKITMSMQTISMQELTDLQSKCWYRLWWKCFKIIRRRNLVCYLYSCELNRQECQGVII